jgi:hypothetical protein
MSKVVFSHADLDETSEGKIVIRGVLEATSLHNLLVAEYQREAKPLASLKALVEAFKAGETIPDIELGLRGDTITQLEDGRIILEDDTYIIDGQQRVNAGRHLVEVRDSVQPRLGAMVHFNTTEPWERERFRTLNMDRTKVGPNVLLRNWRYDHPAVEMLYNLCGDRHFVLHDRVSWKQHQNRIELMSALTLSKVTGSLHSHVAPGRTTRLPDLTSALDRLMENLGRNVLKDNVRTFFDVVDKAWGIQRVTFKEGAIYMHSTFLVALARMFSDHEDFWRVNRLLVEAPTVRKLANFPLHDPSVVQLSSASGKGLQVLYGLMVDHVNSGRRTRRLRNRYGVIPLAYTAATADDDEDEDDVDQA